MHELKETPVKRQFLLRDSPMESQPGTQQRPATLGGIDLNLMEAIPIVIAGVFTPAVADRMRVKARILQWVIEGLYIGRNPGSWGDERLQDRWEGRGRGGFQHPDDHRTAALNPAEKRWLFLLQGSSASHTL